MADPWISLTSLCSLLKEFQTNKNPGLKKSSNTEGCPLVTHTQEHTCLLAHTCSHTHMHTHIQIR